MVVRLEGKVEGNDIIFERMEGDWWRSIIPATLNGVYLVELTAYDDAGNIAYCARYVVTIDTAALCVHLEQYPYYFHVIKGYETEAYISPYYACCEGEYQTESWMSDYYATIMLQKCGGIG